jgi:hypothetical protein
MRQCTSLWQNSSQSEWSGFIIVLMGQQTAWVQLVIAVDEMKIGIYGDSFG